MTEEARYVDSGGDTLSILTYNDGEVMWQTRYSEGLSGARVVLTREAVLDLYHRLADHLMATQPEVQLAGRVEPTVATAERQTITAEAEAAVYGPRGADYGHPREGFTETAILWTGLLQRKLADGAFLEPEDVVRCMIALKLARDVNSPKRDNRVDGAGYFLCLDRLETGR